MLSRRYVEFDTLAQWISVLRSEAWPGPFFPHRDTYPGEGRNVITEGALERDDWDDLLWADSDHMPSPAFIQRLAEYPAEMAVIVGVYFGREAPFDIQAWATNPEEEGLLPIHPAVVEQWLAKPGLYPVGGGGTGWMLIRRRVLEELRELKGPGNVWEIRGLSPALREKLGIGLVIGEDVQFCIDVRKLLGYQVFLDTDPRIESAHLGSVRFTREHWRAAHVVAPDGRAPIPPGHRLEIVGGNREQRRKASRTLRGASAG